MEARDDAKHPIVHSTVLTTKSYLAQNFNSAEVETLRWFKCPGFVGFLKNQFYAVHIFSLNSYL